MTWSKLPGYRGSGVVMVKALGRVHTMRMGSYEFKLAHRHCSANRRDLLDSAVCACFYCEEMYPPEVIHEWIDDEHTAVCPRCGIDTVVSELAMPLPPMREAWLRAMHGYWFQEMRP